MEFIKDLLPYVIPISIGLLTWFYSLTEKRINARAAEHSKLKDEVQELKTEVAVLKSQHSEMFKAIKALNTDFKSHIDEKIESLKELFEARRK
jgi:cell division protein FtsB